MHQTHFYTYTTILGSITIADNGSAITHLIIGDPSTGIVASDANRIKGETPLILEAHRQLEAYLKGTRQSFDLPLAPAGTDFQQKVWNALREIPYGTTQTYTDIARAIGSPSASRAVGTACGRNPVLILTPCHRVIGTNGKLTGFAAGLDVKAALLQLEQANQHNENKGS
ncbi:methylated-DNA--[protein]-cysteine S-methyltransferase [Acidaminobacter hydrogenoformans]|uniref:Methylated-DNA--protein-cysteine methyltransferase n=1 Tax=Acidaminobacter hydrogenoformans DSM 2784 TaxID=1120920 RepID=A0A1G5S5T3_9FIRM|nr:methylated-DNA--[protein]-cysteine S-methyltransferase [Acidaminobacter hydrogenoformans]SCZ81772.1 methylated-DNA-[protein]-cysteine S-methyltransferase [Acidaminobacter hydrogenoformans DSM 2784]